MSQQNIIFHQSRGIAVGAVLFFLLQYAPMGSAGRRLTGKTRFSR
ncbi:hypothetical protein KKH3_31870 [Pectobacterium actinidiae]|nr:hypothetical protein KKH3_31870 [Pectobacterium actinidiae]